MIRMRMTMTARKTTLLCRRHHHLHRHHRHRTENPIGYTIKLPRGVIPKQFWDWSVTASSKPSAIPWNRYCHSASWTVHYPSRNCATITGSPRWTAKTVRWSTVATHCANAVSTMSDEGHDDWIRTHVCMCACMRACVHACR